MAGMDGAVVFAVGFNGFLELNGGKEAIFEPCKLSSGPRFAKFVISASWSAILLLNGDGSLTVRGFLNGKAGQEHTICKPELSPIKSAYLTEEKLFIVTKNGDFQVLEFGTWDVSDNAGLQTELLPVHKWKQIDGFESYNDLSLYGITEKGELYHIGKNMLPTWIPLLLKVTKISCGISHGIILVENGTVYTWGNGSRGQLGHGCLEDQEKPKLVEILCGVTITEVAAGGWHSAALADTGDLYVWGWNESGQLGFPPPKDFHSSSTKPKTQPGKKTDSNETGTDTETISMLSTPKLLELENHLGTDEYVSVIDVSCGTRHSAITTKNGKAVTWGWGKYGQLGQNSCTLNMTTENAKNFNEAVTKRRKVETCGLHGGLQCRNIPHLPGYVEYFETLGIRVTSVHCGPWNTFFVVESA